MPSPEQVAFRKIDQGPIKPESKILIEQATEAALANLPERHSPTAERKVLNAINNCFVPYEGENRIIAAEITSEVYEKQLNRINDFLGTLCGAVVCPDGRILSVSIGDPRYLKIQRSLAGMPDISQPSRGNLEHQVNDSDICATVETQMQKRKDRGECTQLVQFFGPHIDSVTSLNGCGAQKGNITTSGRPAVTAMRYGGIEEYYSKLGEGSRAFKNLAGNSGGSCETIGMTHDVHSQGLIFGLDKLYSTSVMEGKDMFDESFSLRDNLVLMHDERKIIMTELLDRHLAGEITRITRTMEFPESLEIRKPEKLADNIIVISEVAMQLTENFKQNFPFIPDSMTNMSPEAIRTWAYHMIRNCVYRKLGHVEPGRHNLIHHPERLIRVGPIGTAHNVGIIPFIQHAPSGRLRAQDIDGAKFK